MVVTLSIASAILGWYDNNARNLPWRVGPAARKAGVRPDPYRVWLSEIMLQQTTVSTVSAYFERFTARWPNVESLASAPRDDVLAEWAGLGYYARARNLHACAQVIMADHGGSFPRTEAGLRTLPGVGLYTAAAIASIAFDEAATVVDGNIERVMARLHAVEDPLPGAKKRLYAFAAADTPQKRPGDYAQALMDIGATICTPRNPCCDQCPVASACTARTDGIAATLPRKTPKKAKPTRYGICYLAYREDDAILLTTRPDDGLLGGMAELPGTDWSGEAPDPAPPVDGVWRRMGDVQHTFTHFHLLLTVMRADMQLDVRAEKGQWIPVSALENTALPTVMRKAIVCGLGPERLL